MKKAIFFIVSLVIVGFIAAFICCDKIDNNKITGTYNNVRISWDYNTYSEITSIEVENEDYTEMNLYYPRVKRLSDGSLLFSFSNDHYGWDIYTSRSEDNGKTWSKACLIRKSYETTSTVGKDKKVFVNPDFIELQDGRILLAYQWRYKEGYGDIPNTNNNCGIEIVFSDDFGKTWGEPKEMYRGRCWEPAMLQLPSGEIQMYITSSQEVIDGTSCPRTVVVRSFDGGATWQGKECCGIDDNEVISRTVDERFAYDGMPSGVYLNDDKGIVVPLEVWSGKLVVDQTPVIVKTTVEENWYADYDKIINQGGPDYPMKKELVKNFHGYGPYCTKLPTGEVIVLSNGSYKGKLGIWTFIGDKNAENFQNATSPFDGYWGNIDYIGDNMVVATGTVRYKETSAKGSVTRGKIRMMIGRLNFSKDISNEKDSIPELIPLKEFNKDNNDCWFLGKDYASQTFVNFAYNKKSLVFYSYIFTNKITAFTPENSDAAVFLFARAGQQYKMVANANGKWVLYKEEYLAWKQISEGETTDIEVVGTINKDDDIDEGYSAKVSIPWDLIGGNPRSNEEIKVHLMRYHKEKSTEKLPAAYTMESLAGENIDYPQEWLSINL